MENNNIAQEGAQSALMPDSRQPILSHVSDDLYNAQVGVLRVVDDYLNGILPVECINDLLYHWLTTDADLMQKATHGTLFRILGLVNFLTELKSKHEGLQFLINSQKGGHTNEQ